MKKIRFFWFLVAFFMLSNCLLAQEWTRRYFYQTDYKTKVYLKGADTIFVMGWSNFLIRSLDHGKTWVEYILPYMEVDFNDMHFINKDIGFIVSNGGFILKTTKAGDDWLGKRYCEKSIFAISSAHPNSIWAVGEKGVVLFSDDLGETWEIRDFETTQNLNDVSFKNDRGVIVGDSGTCFRSSDKGLSWKKDTIDASLYKGSSPISIGNLSSISQTESYDYVFNVGNNFSYPIIINDNRKFAPNGLHFNSYTFINDTIGYAIYTNARLRYFYIYKTMDGITWDLAYQTSDEFAAGGPFCLTVTNEQVGWAIANNQLFNMHTSISKIKGLLKNNKLFTLKYNNNQLVLTAREFEITSVEIFSISGASKYCNKNNQAETEIPIETSSFPKGLYLIKTTHINGERCFLKWLNQ